MSHTARIFLLLFAPAMALILSWLGLETLSTNPLGWFLLLVGAAYAIGVVIVFYIRKKRFWESSINERIVHEERGDRSFWFISAGMMAAFYLPPIEYLYFPPVLPRAPGMSYCGIGLIILGIGLFVWARRVLGKNYSGHIGVKQGQELVNSGPYRFIRHPAYLGYLLMAFGIGLGYSGIAGLFAILILLLPAMVYRMNVEEQMLASQFGQQYLEYTRKTKRLIPGVW